MRPYYHLTAPIYLLHNHYWIRFQNSHLSDFFQKSYFPYSNVGGILHASKRVSLLVLSVILTYDPSPVSSTFSNPYLYSFDKLYLIIISTSSISSIISLYKSLFYSFQNEPSVHWYSPSILLSFLGTSDLSSSLAFFYWDTPYPLKSNFCQNSNVQ